MHSFLNSNFLLIFFLFPASVYVSLLVISYYHPLSGFPNRLYSSTVFTLIHFLPMFINSCDFNCHLTLNTKFSIFYSITTMPYHFPRSFILAIGIIEPYNKVFSPKFQIFSVLKSPLLHSARGTGLSCCLFEHI